MADQTEQTGLRGVGFLFAMILLFLAVVALKQTGHFGLAARVGLAGALSLSIGSGWFLLRKWRISGNLEAFQENGDVAFCGAVLLLCLIAVGAGVARATDASSRFLPVIPLCLTFAGPIFRRYLRPGRS